MAPVLHTYWQTLSFVFCIGFSYVVVYSRILADNLVGIKHCTCMGCHCGYATVHILLYMCILYMQAERLNLPRHIRMGYECIWNMNNTF